MILAYFCTISCWGILIRNWGYVNDLGKVLLTLIAVASITFVLDAHKERQKARRDDSSDYWCANPDCYCGESRTEEEGMDEWLTRARKRFPNTRPSDLIGFNFFTGEPKENNPYGTIVVGVPNGEEPVNLNDDLGCTDPKTSSRKQSVLSDFYDFCEENGYSVEERPMVFKEWLNEG